MALFTKSTCWFASTPGAEDEAAGVGDERRWSLSAGAEPAAAEAAEAAVVEAAALSFSSPELAGDGGSGTGKRWTRSGAQRWRPDARYASDHEYGTKKSSGFSSSTYLNLSSGDFCAHSQRTCHRTTANMILQ